MLVAALFIRFSLTSIWWIRKRLYAPRYICCNNDQRADFRRSEWGAHPMYQHAPERAVTGHLRANMGRSRAVPCRAVPCIRMWNIHAALQAHKHTYKQTTNITKRTRHAYRRTTKTITPATLHLQVARTQDSSRRMLIKARKGTPSRNQ